MIRHSWKPAAGQALPVFDVQTPNGGSITLGTSTGRWHLLVVYRGKHCGRCKPYLNQIESMQDRWKAAGFDITAISADTAEKANTDINEFGWSFPIGCELDEATMHKLGLYVSDPLTPDETDRRFAEPAVFCLRPDGTVQIAAISNGPSARPDLEALLDGMVFTIENDKPARGTVSSPSPQT
ncbi:MAG: redoxin domain-containing protein [Gammaproteobacteria bacterium]|nr:redoxin domain-containing protein [Gammaproteobacteria bacterium]